MKPKIPKFLKMPDGHWYRSPTPDENMIMLALKEILTPVLPDEVYISRWEIGGNEEVTLDIVLSCRVYGKISVDVDMVNRLGEGKGSGELQEAARKAVAAMRDEAAKQLTEGRLSLIP